MFVGFLTENELSSLRIENMVLHTVGDGNFVPQPARQVEQADFFAERIRETDTAAVFGFEKKSLTKAQIERIAKGEDDFETGAQNLAREFARFHDGTSRKGAFFIFELATDVPKTNIYSLIKYDYEEVVEQTDGNQETLLRLIVQAFVAGKRSIQKAALVRVVDGKAEMALCATDRMKPGADIGDYFASYLHVMRTRTDDELNREVVNVLRNTLAERKEDLPQRDAARALKHAQAHLHDRTMVDEGSIRDAILAAAGNPEDEKTISRFDQSLRRKLKSSKLEGLSFAPNRKILKKPGLRQLRTTEGVLIVYPDDASAATVSREKLDGSGEVITIHTKKVTDDRIVPENARLSAR
ncbi:nucleoid-associated protein [Mesorhizobium sp.]|uniref:nucleoid-associated protein n=1 Tax=Mesorhizobium sp. TaxID=1871066 RepID=UPI0025E0375B|nr:nucleoid-associated protein [Mesorhizobium sp.]